MSSAVILQRFIWFQNEMKRGRHPSARTLAEKFEITGKTAQRNIEFMRDRLGAPLLYVPARRGYACEDDTWELPGLWLGEDELISLILSYRLAAAVPDASVKNALRAILNQVITHHTSAHFSIEDLADKISIKNIAYSRTSEIVFHRLLDALLNTCPVRIEYFSPHNNQTTLRDILPLHLLAYMGTWHIIAHCNMKNELRDFVLSRIKSVNPCDTRMDVRVPAGRVKDYIRETFGIFHGKEKQTVRLRFSKEITPWIAEQVWHRDQKARVEEDGRLCLTLPVADFREIKREIMRYGAQVEVLSPKLLREEVKKEIENMRKIYV